MRFIGRALAASAFVLGACAGGDNANTNTGDTAAAGAAPAGTPAGQQGAQAGTQPGTPAGGGQAPAITGTTHTVRMVVEGTTNYRFIPDRITVRQGDGIRYVNESGGPHNVDFSIANLPANVQTQLAANMPDRADNASKLGPVNGPLLTTPNAVYTVSFANIPPGTYQYQCTPHAAMGMTAQVTVQ